MISAVTFQPVPGGILVKPWTPEAQRFLEEEGLRYDRRRSGYLVPQTAAPELREILLDAGLMPSAFRRNAAKRRKKARQVYPAVRIDQPSFTVRLTREGWQATLFDPIQGRVGPPESGPTARAAVEALEAREGRTLQPWTYLDREAVRTGVTQSLPPAEITMNPDDEDDLDPDGEIKDALEAEAQLDADRRACVALSTMGDQDMMDLEAAGFEDQSAVVISETYKAIAVNGEVLAHEAGRAVLWSEVGTGELISKLREDGFERVPRFGGAYPGGMEIELSSEHIIRYVAREMGIDEQLVARVADEVLGWGELVYRTSDNVDTTYWAKPRKED